MKQKDYDKLTGIGKHGHWMEAIRKVKLRNWEKYFDMLNTIEIDKISCLSIGINKTQSKRIKKVYQKGIAEWMKPFIEKIISLKEEEVFLDILKRHYKGLK